MTSAWLTTPLLALVLTNLVKTSSIPATVNRPPSIVSQSDPILYVLKKSTIVLTCIADAHPSVKSPEGYKWTKNGLPLDVTSETENPPDGSAVMSKGVGTITFKGSENLSEDNLKRHEGVYQCFATNQRGTAMTGNITVKVAEIPFQPPVNKDIEVREGSHLSLPCNYTTSNGQEITWRSENSVNLVSPRIAQQSDGTLVFSNVVADLDNGLVFWCVVKDLAVRKSTDGIHYTLVANTSDPVVEQAVEIVSPQENERIKVLRGQEKLTLNCVTTGKPTPTVRWEIVQGSWPAHRTSIKYSGHTVVIHNVTLEDEGTYRCIANNSLTNEVTKTIAVKVDAKPYYPTEASRPRNITREPGANVTIRCKPEGIPTPTVEWRVNGAPIERAPTMVNREVHQNRIKLKNLLKNESAVYQCVSYNKHGYDIQQIAVNVLTWKPVILEGHQLHYRQVEGAEVELKCRVFGSPFPSIEWSRDGNDVTVKDRFSMQKHKYLEIQKLEPDDSGLYKCAASNPYGDAAVNITLEVLSKTTLKSIGGNVVKVGDAINLNVQVTTDNNMPGESRVTWSKGNIVIGNGHTYTKKTANFNDAGIYTAKVITDIDQAEVNITLIVVDKPFAPEDFTFKESRDDPLKVTFTWTPAFDNYAPVTDYIIEFEEDTYQPGKWQTLKEAINGFANRVQVTLSPGVNYQFRARSRNSVGFSRKPTNATRRYKTPNGLPANPTGVRCEGRSPGSIMVSWNSVPGLSQNAPGFGYLVSFRPVKMPDDWKTTRVPGDKSSFELAGFPPYEQYVVKLQSYNAKGNATKSTAPVTAFSGEGIPKASPSAVTISEFTGDPTKVTVTWKRVDEKLVLGMVQGYNITYRKEAGKSISSTVVGDKTSTIVKDLRPDTKYVFTVSVFNRAGSSEPSEPVPVTTMRGVPGEGRINVTADAAQANVTWFPGEGLPADKILVQYKKDKEEEAWKNTPTYFAKLEPMSMHVSPLQPGTSYSFRVVSMNRYGNATSTSYSVKTTHEEVAAAGVTSQIWFIVMMCAIGLLILVVLIICFVRRRKGGKYSVAEKEHHLVESQPMEKDSSGDYNDDETDDLKKPLTSSTGASSNGDAKGHPGEVPLGAALRTRGDSVGGDSIEAFVGADPKEFNEDGSFIGQYGIIPGSENTTPATPPSGDDKSPTQPESNAV